MIHLPFHRQCIAGHFQISRVERMHHVGEIAVLNPQQDVPFFQFKTLPETSKSLLRFRNEFLRTVNEMTVDENIRFSIQSKTLTKTEHKNSI